MRNYLFLFLIFLLGFILRVIFIGEAPPSLHRDEAFLGYNAYSILETGKDISGEFLPVHLESFYFSPAGYSYLSIPFIAAFGLTESSVRLASAIFGSFTVILVYLLTMEIFEKNKKREMISLVCAFLFAITPWHINLSRVATENVPVLFFILLGAFLYLKYLKSNKLFLLIASFVSFALTLGLYQAPRGFVPLFIPLLIFAFVKNKELLRLRKEYLLFALLLIPIFAVLLSPDLSWRISSLSIFNHPETQLVINEQITTDTVQGFPYLLSRVFHNKVIGFTSLFIENLFSHLSFNFLFTDAGFPDRYRIPHMGLLYLFQLPLILIGLFLLVKDEIRVAGFLITWVIVGVFASALTFDDVPNLQRTLFVVPPISIISAYGFFTIYSYLKKKNRLTKNISFALLAFILIFSASYYLVQYYIQGKVYRPWYRQSGYKELVLEVNERIGGYDAAVITIRESAPTIFFLFYGDYLPHDFQKETRNENLAESDHINFSKYRFAEEECPLRIDEKSGELIGEKNILYVNSSLCETPVGAEQIGVIKRSDGSEAFRLVRVGG